MTTNRVKNLLPSGGGNKNNGGDRKEISGIIRFGVGIAILLLIAVLIAWAGGQAYYNSDHAHDNDDPVCKIPKPIPVAPGGSWVDVDAGICHFALAYNGGVDVRWMDSNNQWHEFDNIGAYDMVEKFIERQESWKAAKENTNWKPQVQFRNRLYNWAVVVIFISDQLKQ